MKAILALAVLLALAGDPFDAGLLAYREGRFKEALERFREVERSSADGGDASAELQWNLSLAALRAGSLTEAASAAEKAAALGGAEFVSRRDFLLGNVAFARGLLAAAVADSPEAEPFAFDSAIALAETAKSLWQRAAASRDDWPEARRNVERAILEIDALRKKKDDAEKKRKKEAESSKPQENPPKEERKPEEPVTEESPQPRAETRELTAEELMRLLDKIDAKEREKLRLRRSERRTPKPGMEKDW